MLGLAHAVLHAKPGSTGSSGGSFGSSFAATLGRTFHGFSHPAHPADDGACRLYAQAAQGDLAAGAVPVALPAGACAAPAATAVASADAAPRHASGARGPPDRV